MKQLQVFYWEQNHKHNRWSSVVNKLKQRVYIQNLNFFYTCSTKINWSYMKQFQVFYWEQNHKHNRFSSYLSINVKQFQVFYWEQNHKHNRWSSYLSINDDILTSTQNRLSADFVAWCLRQKINFNGLWREWDLHNEWIACI